MTYEVIITQSAEEDLERFIRYLLLQKKSKQAAKQLLSDFEATKNILSNVAEKLMYCKNLRLKKLGYRRINFQHHRYFLLYRVEGNTAIVDGMFHELQDYRNILK